MTTPDFPDWQQPVSVIDHSVSVLPASPTTLFPAIPSAPFDVSRYSSLLLRLESAPAAPVGERYTLWVQWSEQGVTMDSDVITFHSLTSYLTPVPDVSVRLPVRGSSVVLLLVSSGPTSVQVWAIGSTRPTTEIRCTPGASNATRKLIDNSIVGLAAGGSTPTLYVPPVTRAVAIRSSLVNSVLEFDLSGVDWNGGPPAAIPMRIVNGSVVDLSMPEIPVVATGLELVVKNNDTVAHTFTYQVWDVS